jgi:hypothetical protein
MNHFARDMFIFGLILPVTFILFVALGAFWLSRARYPLLIFPIIAGVMASAALTVQMGAPLKAFWIGCLIYSLVALGIGGLLFLIRTFTRSQRK